MDKYEQKLLDGWEEVFKKGQLTLWIMLALKDGSKHMAEIKEFIHCATNGSLTADDQSMYRALRRYRDVEMIDYTQEPGEGGPDRKIYQLTQTGEKVLAQFLDRNITGVFYKPDIEKLVRDERRTT